MFHGNMETFWHPPEGPSHVRVHSDTETHIGLAALSGPRSSAFAEEDNL